MVGSNRATCPLHNNGGSDEVRITTMICCRKTRISASNAARGRIRSTTIQKIILQRSNIPQRIIRFCVSRQLHGIYDRDRRFSPLIRADEFLNGKAWPPHTYSLPISRRRSMTPAPLTIRWILREPCGPQAPPRLEPQLADGRCGN